MKTNIWCWVASKQKWQTYGLTDCKNLAELRGCLTYPSCFALAKPKPKSQEVAELEGEINKWLNPLIPKNAA